MNLDTPDVYYAAPAHGSGIVKAYIDADANGDFATFISRRLHRPWVDGWRGLGYTLPDTPEWRLIVRNVERTRTKSTRAMHIGSLIEVGLWTPDYVGHLPRPRAQGIGKFKHKPPGGQLGRVRLP